MASKFQRGPAALLFFALLLAVPTASFGADNVAEAPSPAAADNVAVLPADNTSAPPEDDLREPSFGEGESAPLRIADPIEPINRALFVFNDKAYYWVFKPVAEGYDYVVGEDFRISIRNFFSNLATPIRFANHLLQGELRASGTELIRFALNSTTGILGLFDTARDNWGFEKKDADLGQTLGKYGLGNGFYIVWPLLGPSTLRDTAGYFGDSILDPVSYVQPAGASIGVKGYREENNLSLRIGVYEELTGAAVDPYVAVRDAYVQSRAKAVRKPPRRGPAVD
ncbi:MAG: VacJ family lipoprotein [Thermodesulfobacteriota bacterium]